jgi:hypothetical protein
MTQLADIEKRRADRKAALVGQELAQRALDLEAVDALEVQYGDSNVDVIDVAYTPGLPTCFAVRVPTDPEMRRYKSRLKGIANSKDVDAIAAAEELGESCLIYPAQDIREQMKSARPGALSACGTAALKLCQGRLSTEGKG